MTAPLGQALRPRRPDVVEAEHVEEARAGDPGDDRQRDRPQHDRRQDQVAERVDEEPPLGRRAGRSRCTCSRGSRRPPGAGPGRPVMPQRTASGTTETPGVSRPEGGSANGVSLSRIAKTNAASSPRTKTGIETPMFATGHRQRVGGRVAPNRRDDAEEDPDDRREDQREDRQLDGHRQALDQQVRHRAVRSGTTSRGRRGTDSRGRSRTAR